MQSGEPEWQGSVHSLPGAQPLAWGAPWWAGQRSQREWGTPPRGGLWAGPPSSPGGVHSAFLPHPPDGAMCSRPSLGERTKAWSRARGRPCSGRLLGAAPLVRGGGGGGVGGGGCRCFRSWAGPSPGLFPLMAGPSRLGGHAQVCPCSGAAWGQTRQMAVRKGRRGIVHVGSFQAGLWALQAPALGPRVAWVGVWGELVTKV